MIQFIAGAIFGGALVFMILAIVGVGSDKREEREIEDFKKKL